MKICRTLVIGWFAAAAASVAGTNASVQALGGAEKIVVPAAPVVEYATNLPSGENTAPVRIVECAGEVDDRPCSRR